MTQERIAVARGVTRQAFLLSGILSLGSAVLPGSGVAIAQTGGGDADILNVVLTLGLLQARFYERALNTVEELDEADRPVIAELRDHESEHVRVVSRLMRRLGDTPVTEPRFDFGDAFSSRSRFLEVAQQLEELGVAAGNGSLTRIADPEVLSTTGAIVGVQARHAALIRILREEPFAPDAFDRRLPRGDVVERVEPFLAD